MVGVFLFLVATVIAVSRPASAEPVTGMALAPTPQYLAIGLGVSPLDGVAASFQIGREFHRNVAWFDEFDAVVNDHGDIPTVHNLTQLLLVTGARWTLASKSPDTLLQPEAVYLKAGIAFEVWPVLDARPGLAFALGYLPLQGPRWALGIEGRAGVALPASSGSPLACTLVFEVTN